MTLFTGHLKHSAFPFKRIICPTLRARLLQKSQLSCATSSLKCFHKYSTAVDKEDDIFPLRYLFLKTSVDMWEEFPHGVTFDVGKHYDRLAVCLARLLTGLKYSQLTILGVSRAFLQLVEWMVQN